MFLAATGIARAFGFQALGSVLGMGGEIEVVVVELAWHKLSPDSGHLSDSERVTCLTTEWRRKCQGLIVQSKQVKDLTSTSKSPWTNPCLRTSQEVMQVPKEVKISFGGISIEL